MDYSRRQFLALATAGLSAAAVSLASPGTAYADSPPSDKSQGPERNTRVLDLSKPYGQRKADEIHDRSMERDIKKAGKEPAEIKARVNRRIRRLEKDLTR